MPLSCWPCLVDPHQEPRFRRLVLWVPHRQWTSETHAKINAHLQGLPPLRAQHPGLIPAKHKRVKCIHHSYNTPYRRRAMRLLRVPRSDPGILTRCFVLSSSGQATVGYSTMHHAAAVSPHDFPYEHPDHPEKMSNHYLTRLSRVLIAGI